MKIREFLKIEEEITGQIPEKFRKISEIVKDCICFNGAELVKHPGKYKDITQFKDYNYSCKVIEFCDNDFLISWTDNLDDYCSIIVSENFFDNFEEYLKEIKEYVRKNNEAETEKYNRYLEKQNQLLKVKETKEYQEFLRLKEIYDK